MPRGLESWHSFQPCPGVFTFSLSGMGNFSALYLGERAESGTPGAENVQTPGHSSEPCPDMIQNHGRLSSILITTKRGDMSRLLYRALQLFCPLLFFTPASFA